MLTSTSRSSDDTRRVFELEGDDEQEEKCSFTAELDTVSSVSLNSTKYRCCKHLRPGRVVAE